MTLIVKIMSAEDTADSDTRKTHRLFAGVDDVEFGRQGPDEPPVVHLRFKPEFRDAEAEVLTIALAGNVYVMNEAGKTISSFGCAPIVYAAGEPTEAVPATPRREWTETDTRGLLKHLGDGASVIQLGGPGHRIEVEWDVPRAHAELSQLLNGALPTAPEQIAKVVDRFLGWGLPRNFAPDGGISFDAARLHPAHWPTGTNLFDATQARDMVEHILRS